MVGMYKKPLYDALTPPPLLTKNGTNLVPTNLCEFYQPPTPEK